MVFFMLLSRSVTIRIVLATSHIKMDILLFLSFWFCSVCAFNFNLNDVKEIHANNDSYFGYALLLQKGSQPSVIVGAPRQVSGHSGGSVHSCAFEGKCTKYNITASSANTPNGNFLGAVLDGGENIGDQFIACAPRIVKALQENNFLIGWCFLKENSSSYGTYNSIIKPLEKEPTISMETTSKSYYYDNAFGETGIDMQYLKETKQVLLGAPGVKSWNGALIVQSLSTLTEYKIIPKRYAPVLIENDGYLGYKVTSARFDAKRQNIWYVAGAPRAGKLLGNVKIFNSVGTLTATLTGEELGSYFGSTILAVDLNNDHIDDLLVGAPMGAGTTWDEGYVYFYKSDRSKGFFNSVKLVGAQKEGARFGTSIVSLGDVDLDSYNDIAISAPYEDGGVGAVYIYMGSQTGISAIYSQRLSPKEFPFNVGAVKGFGQGLSRGVDVDGNGHNDLAVGAYKSNQVFIIKTVSVIDYQLTLESNVSSISTNFMNVKFCIRYTQRSKTRDLPTVNFKTELLLDYRVEGETYITDILQVALAQDYCKSLDIIIKKSSTDILPFKMTLKSKIEAPNVIGKGDTQIEKSIPYSHECGDDNICQTKILVTTIPSLPSIVLGEHKEITVTLIAENVGEPGYGCELYLNFPNALELRDTRDCKLENNTYVCPFSSIFRTVKEIQFKFDIKLRSPDLDEIPITFEVKCLGDNSIPGINKNELIVEVLLRNAPYIQGSSVPDSFYFTDDDMNDVEATHVFKIGNSGPSPVKLDVFLLLPTVKNDGVDIFEIDAKGSFNGIQVQCYPTNNTFEYDNTTDIQSLLTEPLNRTIVIDCFEEGKDCLGLFCRGEYLYKSSDIAEYNLKVTMKIKLLASHYRTELLKKHIVAYISRAYLYSSSNTRVESHSTTRILASNSKPVPLWIYIAGSIIGILLLALVIFIMYKCHFFDRNYRDRLNGEKLMDKQIEDDTDKSEDNPNP